MIVNICALKIPYQYLTRKVLMNHSGFTILSINNTNEMTLNKIKVNANIPAQS